MVHGDPNPRVPTQPQLFFSLFLFIFGRTHAHPHVQRRTCARTSFRVENPGRAHVAGSEVAGQGPAGWCPPREGVWHKVNAWRRLHVTCIGLRVRPDALRCLPLWPPLLLLLLLRSFAGYEVNCAGRSSCLSSLEIWSAFLESWSCVRHLHPLKFGSSNARGRVRSTSGVSILISYLCMHVNCWVTCI